MEDLQALVYRPEEGGEEGVNGEKFVGVEGGASDELVGLFAWGRGCL